MHHQILLGIDTGGTFTDFVMLSDDGIKVHKVLSSPSNPAASILKGIGEMGLEPAIEEGLVKLVHGTTVATNAVLERKGVKTVYITNSGFKDVLYIGRQARSRLYDLLPQQVEPLASDAYFLEVDCRVDATGKIISELNQEDLASLARRVEQLAPESIAINLLFSFVNDQHEKTLEACFKENYFVARSSFVLPEYKEFERGMATWINAWIGPLIHRYLLDLRERLSPCHLSIMQSSGVTIEAGHAARRAVNLLLSGPVAGVTASGFAGRQINRHHLISFDMGGTSTDVSLYAGALKLTDEGKVGDFPVAIPMADIHTIGAGGGSIAFIDEGGLLQVGPASAGADPGPACYGRGGLSATVTDANLILGRLLAEEFLGGQLLLSKEASVAALSPLAQKLNLSIEDTASGIIGVANEHMIQALREISIQQGYDPVDFMLVSFGGAGGLHFCELAEALEMTTVLIPLNAGVFSAFGMLVSPPGRQLIRTYRKLLQQLSDTEITTLISNLAEEGISELVAEGCDAASLTDLSSLDLRYLGQTFTLNLPWTGIETISEAFHQLHESRYGHRIDKPIEMVNLRASLTAHHQVIDMPIPGSGVPVGNSFKSKNSGLFTNLAGYEKPVMVQSRKEMTAYQTIEGPCLIIEDHATHYIKEEWQGKMDENGNLVFSRQISSS